MAKRLRGRRGVEQRSSEAEAYHRWYKTARWQRLRAAHLATEPLCRMCLTDKRAVPATVCDHVEPHRGNERAFWAGPFQSLCKPHHDSTKQREEKQGRVIGGDIHGWPLDPAHPWNRS
jgi:5-methylcytosine-specific restriction protein A